jgi:hypothetical protein
MFYIREHPNFMGGQLVSFSYLVLSSEYLVHLASVHQTHENLDAYDTLSLVMW